MVKYLSSILRFFAYIRECVFYEAYLSDKGNDRGSVIFPAFIVGVFDSMIFIAMATVLFSESGLMEASLSGRFTDFYKFLSVFFVFSIEVVYYQVIFDGSEIIRRFEGFNNKRLILVKVIGFTYVCMAVAGVGVAVFHS